jgi:hypothetical protein
VAVSACAYGHRPKGFDDLLLASQVGTSGGAQAFKLKLSSSCSLAGKKPLVTWTVPPDTVVVATATLFWDGTNLTGGATYKYYKHA